jgi:chorismate mutase
MLTTMTVPHAADAGATDEPTDRITALRSRINAIDEQMIELWRERAALSREVGSVRVASGGTRLALSREREILEHFKHELGEDGTQLALLLLRAGRGRL